MDNEIIASVVIPVYNGSKTLQKTLESIFAQTFPARKFEIIVVDDGSNDNTRELIVAIKANCSHQLRYFYQDNKGPAAARNLGIKHALGPIVAFIDSDCAASADWVEEIVKGYGDLRLAGVGGVIKAAPTASLVSQYCDFVRMNEKPDRIIELDIYYLITANASFRKQYLVEVGGFDERYDFPGGEDPDICYRLEKKGYLLICNPCAIVYNPHKQTFKEFSRTFYNYGKGNSFLAMRKLSKWDLCEVSGLNFIYYFVKAAARNLSMCFSYLSLIRSLLRLPCKALSYYGREGFSVRKSLVFSVLDCLKIECFLRGCIVGYLIGKFRGFKISSQKDYLK